MAVTSRANIGIMQAIAQSQRPTDTRSEKTCLPPGNHAFVTTCAMHVFGSHVTRVFLRPPGSANSRLMPGSCSSSAAAAMKSWLCIWWCAALLSMTTGSICTAST